MINKSKASLRFSCFTLMLAVFSCTSSKPLSTLNQTGESPESALVVDTVEAEYRWINEHYPNARVLVQEVIQQSEKSYDVVTIRTEEEERKTFYFDISKFYRKK